jgi:hypothetical protein
MATDGMSVAVAEIAADTAAVRGSVANALWRRLSGIKLLMGSLLLYRPGKGSESGVYTVLWASDQRPARYDSSVVRTLLLINPNIAS